MIHVYICGGLPLSVHDDDLLLGVSADGLKLRPPAEYRIGDYVAMPQTPNCGNYELAAIHRIEREQATERPS